MDRAFARQSTVTARYVRSVVVWVVAAALVVSFAPAAMAASPAPQRGHAANSGPVADQRAKETREALSRRTSIITEANVAGAPLAGARVSAATVDGRRLKMVGQQPRTDGSGMASFTVAGRHRAFIVTMTGGKYGYNPRSAKLLRSAVAGFGRAGDAMTIVSPETSLAVAEFRSGGSGSVQLAVRRTEKFLRLPVTGSAFDLGSLTGTDSSLWAAKRFQRLVVRAGGTGQYSKAAVRGIGKRGEHVWPARTQKALDGLGGQITDAVFGGVLNVFTGGIGNLINAGVCAINGVLPEGYDVVASLFTGCSTGSDVSPEVIKRLDDIQTSINQLTDAIKGIDASVKEAAFVTAYTTSQIRALGDQLKTSGAALKALATTHGSKPTGTESRTSTPEQLCDKAYPRTKVGYGQTPYSACLLIYQAYALFTNRQPHVADTLYHALGEVTPGSNVITTFERSLGAGNKFISGTAQRQLTQFYSSALSTQQTAFLTSIAWARLFEAWTGGSPTCDPLPSSYVIGSFVRNLDDSCDLAQTGLHDLSVELRNLNRGPTQAVDQDVLIDPNGGFSWWKFAFDGTGATLRTDNPAKPFFGQPYEGWATEDLPSRVYGSVALANRPFDLPGGTQQHYFVANSEQAKRLVESVTKQADPNKSVSALMQAAGFVGPALQDDMKTEAKWGMNWNQFGLDLKQQSFPISFTFAEQHYWGHYLNTDEIAGKPCDTRPDHAAVTDERFLWPNLTGSYGCTFKGWGAYIAFDARKVANSDLTGVWAKTSDRNVRCPDRISGFSGPNFVYDPVCTDDTFGLLVDPTNVLWTDNYFSISADSEIPALVLPPFARILAQTKPQVAFRAVSYQASGSGNDPDEQADIFLECAKNKLFATGVSKRKLAPKVRIEGTKVVDNLVSLTPDERPGYCRVRAVNSGAETISNVVPVG